MRLLKAAIMSNSLHHKRLQHLGPDECNAHCFQPRATFKGENTSPASATRARAHVFDRDKDDKED